MAHLFGYGSDSVSLSSIVVMEKSQHTSLEKGTQVIKEVVKTLPNTPGVYRMLNAQGVVLYVGKAKDLKNRVVSYTKTTKLPNRLQRMVAETTHMEIVTTHSETEALLLESNLIKKFLPRYNILLKDDKSFPYIVLTQDHLYPRLTKHRGAKTIKGDYFGPFASVRAVETTLITLHRIFHIRSCTDSFFASRERPCLQYHIKRCSAPCVNRISSNDYTESVKQAKAFLAGKTDKAQSYLAEQMTKASEIMAYEDAAIYRDRLRLLTKIQAHQRINVRGVKDADVIALVQEDKRSCLQIFFFRGGQNYGTESFFLAHDKDTPSEKAMGAFINQFYQDHTPPPLVLLSHIPAELPLVKSALAEKHKRTTRWEKPKLGTKKEIIDHALTNARGILSRKMAETASINKILEALVTLFDLPQRPERIEVYDNSHLQGSNPYGVMVVATPQGFDKKSYRKFKIKKEGPAFGGDDYSMMEEVLERRFAHADDPDWILPDLILVDGGLGQLNIARKVIKNLDVDGVTVIGIAKGPDRNAGRERFFQEGKEPYTLPENSMIMHFLQRLRDEAHRFAIGSHRAKREKNIRKSVLDDISGIGPSRKKALLRHFGSARSVTQASLQDLQSVPGINKSVAKLIYQYFHKG